MNSLRIQKYKFRFNSTQISPEILGRLKISFRKMCLSEASFSNRNFEQEKSKIVHIEIVKKFDISSWEVIEHHHSFSVPIRVVFKKHLKFDEKLGFPTCKFEQKIFESNKVQFLTIYSLDLIKPNSILEFVRLRLYIKIKSKFEMNPTTRKKLLLKFQKKLSLKFKSFLRLDMFRIRSHRFG